MASSERLTNRFVSGTVRLEDEPITGIEDSQDYIERLSRRCTSLEKGNERQMTAVNVVHSHICRLEERFEKNQVDLAYVQNQLEFVVVNLERLSGIVTNHTEQLRLFAGEAGRRNREHTTSRDTKKLILTLTSWLYVPFVYFVKGLYTLFSPVIITIGSLSLFNSDVHESLSDNFTQSQWADARNPNLLAMLRNGTFDPQTVANQKQATNTS